MLDTTVPSSSSPSPVSVGPQEAESVAAVTCLSLFTRFERLSLERIVGEDRARHMLGSAKNTFLFC